VKMVFPHKMFTFNEANTVNVWRSRTPAGIRCAHFASVITKIMDHKGQLLKPVDIRELYERKKHLFRTKHSYITFYRFF
jgi:hypothetical protein